MSDVTVDGQSVKAVGVPQSEADGLFSNAIDSLRSCASMRRSLRRRSFNAIDVHCRRLFRATLCRCYDRTPLHLLCQASFGAVGSSCCLLAPLDDVDASGSPCSMYLALALRDLRDLRP